MTKQHLIKRILKYFLGVVVFLVLVVIFLWQNPHFLVQAFFGVVADSVEIASQQSYSPRETDEKTTTIVAAANLFLTSLNDKQKQAVMYAFDDNEQRVNWSNLPADLVPRGGLKLGQLTKEQRGHLDALFAEFMSDKGVQKINYQLVAEDTSPPSLMLKMRTKDLMIKHRTQGFYVTFLGEPSASLPWMFQFGGHHLGINITVYGVDLSFSPMLTGGGPLHINHDGREIFLTEEETEAAQTFLDSLTDEQKKIAVRGTKAVDWLLGPGKFGTVIEPEGIKGSSLTDAQKQLLLNIINARLDYINDDDRAAIMTTIIAELDDTYFGWWGEQGRLGFAYYRITAPSLVLEYSPQDDDNDSPTDDHAHNMYRNPKNDYGSAWLGEDHTDK